MLEKTYWIIKVFSIPCIVVVAAVGIARSSAEFPTEVVGSTEIEPVIEGDTFGYDVELLDEDGERPLYMHGLRRKDQNGLLQISNDGKGSFNPWCVELDANISMDLADGGDELEPRAVIGCKISRRGEIQNLPETLTWETTNASFRLEQPLGISRKHHLDGCKKVFNQALELRIELRTQTGNQP